MDKRDAIYVSLSDKEQWNLSEKEMTKLKYQTPHNLKGDRWKIREKIEQRGLSSTHWFSQKYLSFPSLTSQWIKWEKEGDSLEISFYKFWYVRLTPSDNHSKGWRPNLLATILCHKDMGSKEEMPKPFGWQCFFYESLNSQSLTPPKTKGVRTKRAKPLHTQTAKSLYKWG